MTKILKCNECQTYGLSRECSCGGKMINPKPPKYSPEDKYQKYRLEYKKEKGLL